MPFQLRYEGRKECVKQSGYESRADCAALFQDGGRMKVKELIAELKNCPKNWEVGMQTSADLGMFFYLDRVIPSEDEKLKFVTLFGVNYDDFDDDEDA